jgi:hypothetical protein
MYAAGLNTSGGPEVVEHPAPGQLRVKVRAAISPVDVMVRDGSLADWLTGNLAARLGRPVQRIAAASSERPYALWTPEIGPRSIWMAESNTSPPGGKASDSGDYPARYIQAPGTVRRGELT